MTKKKLADGLRLRFATAADADRLAEFDTQVFTLPDGRPDHGVADWTRDLLSGRHPTTSAANFTVVEDTRAGQIVSSLCLIPQTWTFDGIPFGVGRVEIVGTLAEYRRRGLVRAQMEVIHARSAQLGHLAQGITGIPYYYRQFGYEYALDLGGGHGAFWAAVPPAKEGEDETLCLRPPVESDVPLLMRLAERRNADQRITAVWDENYWRWWLFGQRGGSAMAGRIEIVEARDGKALGYVGYSNVPWDTAFGVFDLALDEGVPWNAVAAPLMRALKPRAEALAREWGKEAALVQFGLGQSHPFYDVANHLLTVSRPPYAWYIRVADLPGFLRHVAPALETRLAASSLAGYSGELKVNEYRSGFKLVFEKGRLDIGDWEPPSAEEGEAAFPPLVLLQLLFGYRSLAELKHAFPDCWTRRDSDAEALLNALFPKKPTRLIAVV